MSWLDIFRAEAEKRNAETRNAVYWLCSAGITASTVFIGK